MSPFFVCLKSVRSLYLFIYLFIGHTVTVAMHRFLLPRTDCCCCAWAFSSCSKCGLLSSCGAQSSCSRGFSSCGTQALQCTGSIVVVPRLSFPMACGNLPRPGIISVSPTLAGGFLTTEAPGKTPTFFFKARLEK